MLGGLERRLGGIIWGKVSPLEDGVDGSAGVLWSDLL